MTDIELLLNHLADTPAILTNLLRSIPKSEVKTARIRGKWSIHENACHLAESERMILDRFYVFGKESHPVFTPYLPGKTVSADHLLDLDLDVQMQKFTELRNEMVALLRSFTPDIWSRDATHPEYKEYTPYILLRHILLHDHFHMYRMEELWLTHDAYLRTS
jgi:hypothetical protein